MNKGEIAGFIVGLHHYSYMAHYTATAASTGKENQIAGAKIALFHFLTLAVLSL